MVRPLRRVFEPYTLGNVELKNRIVRAAHGTGLPVGGLVSDELLAYHEARARGGVAMTTLEVAGVHWSSPGYLDVSSDRCLPGLRRMSDLGHAHGMRVFQQLWHAGPNVMPVDGSAPWSASYVPGPELGLMPHVMTVGDIEELVAAFATGAARVREAGLDGVEVHGGHGYLFSQFLSGATNERDDRYGGTLESRARLLTETMLAIRKAVGDDFAIGVRLSHQDPQPDAAPDFDLAELTTLLEESCALDFVNLSYGSYYQLDKLIGSTIEPHGYMIPVIEKAARAATSSTIVTGRFLSLDDAEGVLETELADLVSLVRAMIADPDLITKTTAGRVANVRPCIGCNQGCTGGNKTRGFLNCTVNPGAGKELRLGDDHIATTTSPRRIVVVGGGPAGMETARAAALAGHSVVLFEREQELGGQLRFLRGAPTRAEVASLIPYYEAELERTGVDVRLGVAADAGTVMAASADVVIVATGSTPRRDGFQMLRPGQAVRGLDAVDILTSWDVLAGMSVGERVLVLDDVGHYESMDVAEHLTDGGSHVHFVTRYANIGARLEMRWDMVGQPHLRRLLGTGRFELHPRSMLVGVGPGTADVALIDHPASERSLAVDTFVLISGNVPEPALPEALRTEGVELRVVGDAVSPRHLEAAITEGQVAISSLEPGWVRPALRYGHAGASL